MREFSRHIVVSALGVVAYFYGLFVFIRADPTTPLYKRQEPACMVDNLVVSFLSPIRICSLSLASDLLSQNGFDMSAKSIGWGLFLLIFSQYSHPIQKWNPSEQYLFHAKRKPKYLKAWQYRFIFSPLPHLKVSSQLANT